MVAWPRKNEHPNGADQRMQNILYHANCADGFGAAYACWRSIQGAAETSYIPVQYGEQPPAMTDGSDLWIVDFSYPRETLIELAARHNSVTVIDHHKTAAEQLFGLHGSLPNLYVVFDMEKSGAVMAWEYWFPSAPVPKLLAYIQDRDLWQWKLPWSREFSAALAAAPQDFESWEAIAHHVESKESFEQFVSNGGLLLGERSLQVRRLATRVIFLDIEGHVVPTVNSPIHQSEIGEELCIRYPEAPFSAVWSAILDKTTEDERPATTCLEVWSLRSRNGFDVSAVAESLGGGGHAAAAGFRRRREFW